ncbi:MAG: signal peptidase I [Candidatus Poribacteria bacterium]
MKESQYSPYIKTIWDYLKVIIVAFIIVFGFIRPFVVEGFQIPSGSMEDTLLEGDRIFVCKFMYGIKIPGVKSPLFAFHKPQRGDVIVFIPPHDRKHNFIKRLVALPGDTVETKNLGKDLYINGKLVNDKEYAKHKIRVVRRGPRMRLAREFEKGEELDISDDEEREKFYQKLHGARLLGLTDYANTVPEGHVFAMGDNRDNSYDSRGWGFVDINDIKGQAFMIYWSYSTNSRWNIFKNIRFGRIFNILHSQKIP